MGIDIEGGMIVGAPGDEIKKPDGEDDLWGWVHSQGLTSYAPYYDAAVDDCIIGYAVDDVKVTPENMRQFIAEVISKANKFKDLTGTDATLYGMQDVW